MSVVEAVEHLVGLQAQLPSCSYVSLWSRLEGFRMDSLGDLLAERGAVRATMMRGTIHLMSAADALRLRPLLQDVLERDVYPNATFGKEKLAGLDMPSVLAAGRELLEQEARSAAQLRELMAPMWPDRDPAALAYAVRVLLPVVHVPPRGIWGRSGPIAFRPMDSWLGAPLADDVRLETLISRYLAAFGPATVADAQTWSGLRGLREVFERMRPELVTFRDERGRELFDLPDAPRPGEDTPVPPRLLPEYDNVLLSHADRTRVMSEEHRRVIQSRNGQLPGTFLVDGMLAGIWTVRREKDAATLTLRPFDPLPRVDAEALASTAHQLLEFTDEEAARREVCFAEE